MYTDDGTYISASDRPSYKKEILVYGQPQDVVVATLSDDGEFTILNAMSPASDPRLLIITCDRLSPLSSCRAL